MLKASTHYTIFITMVATQEDKRTEVQKNLQARCYYQGAYKTPKVVFYDFPGPCTFSTTLQNCLIEWLSNNSDFQIDLLSVVRIPEGAAAWGRA